MACPGQRVAIIYKDKVFCEFMNALFPGIIVRIMNKIIARQVGFT